MSGDAEPGSRQFVAPTRHDARGDRATGAVAGPPPATNSQSTPGTVATAALTLTVPFTAGVEAISTGQSYSGQVRITVSGSGQAAGTQLTDAFYLYTDSSGNPVSPTHYDMFTLAINGFPTSHYLSTIPAYQPSHTYTFTIALSDSAPIFFGVNDNNFSDNSGAFTVTVDTTTLAQVSVSFALGSGDKNLRIAVTLNGQPASALVFRHDSSDPNTPAINLGITDANGILFTTIESTDYPNADVTSAPVFDGIANFNGDGSGGTPIAPVAFRFTTSAVYGVIDKTLTGDQASGINFEESLATVNPTNPRFSIRGCLPCTYFTFALTMITLGLKFSKVYTAAGGDVVHGGTYSYTASGASDAALYRTIFKAQRGGQTVYNQSAWSTNLLDVLPPGTQQLSSSEAVIVGLASPANLYVTDPQGRHTGIDPSTGQFVNEIPDSYYTGPGAEPQSIAVFSPIPGTYTTEAVGTGTGTVHLEAMSFTAAGDDRSVSTVAAVVPGQAFTQQVKGYAPAGYPTVTKVSPGDSGPAGGGLVTITGANFRAGATVTVAGVPAIGVSVISPSVITCYLPPMHNFYLVLYADVIVTNTDGTDTTPGGVVRYTERYEPVVIPGANAPASAQDAARSTPQPLPRPRP